MFDLDYWMQNAIDSLKRHMDKMGAYDISVSFDIVDGIVNVMKVKETGADFDLSLTYDMPSEEEVDAETAARIAANNAELEELLSAIAPEGE